MTDSRVLEEAAAILLLMRRQVAYGTKLGIATKDGRQSYEILSCDPESFALVMTQKEIADFKLAQGDKVTLGLEDRSMKYEGVVTFDGYQIQDHVGSGRFTLPRSLRRTDSHRYVSYVPDTAVKCSFSNARGTLLDGTIRGMSSEGLELALNNPRQNPQDVFRIGEEATIDIPMEGNQKFTAATKVAYFGESCVGLEFSNKSDKAMLGEYRKWLDNQQRAQIARDREEFDAGGGRMVRAPKAADTPAARILADRDPLILVLSEREDVAKRLADALGRKFGFAHLNYIKGPLQPQVKDLAPEGGWGRIRMVLVHNQLMVASPLEVTKFLVEHERCPLPVIICGTEEDAELKANRAIAHGAVDYVPIEPFKILSVMKRLDDTLKLFEGM